MPNEDSVVAHNTEMKYNYILISYCIYSNYSFDDIFKIYWSYNPYTLFLILFMTSIFSAIAI